MTLEQLESLAKNPHYKLSHKQLAELEQKRSEKFVRFKHSQVVDKHNFEPTKHKTELSEGGNGK